MKTASYLIPNISCMHCVHTIKMELSELDGVKNVDASAETKRAMVEYDDPATETLIISLLHEINYPPEL